MSLREEIGKMDVDLLHIYPQAFWHDNAVVLGNRSALERLLNTVQKALDIGEAFTEVMTTDGEGYNVYVKVLNDPWDGEKWTTVSLPYSIPEIFANHAGEWVPVSNEENRIVEWIITNHICEICKGDNAKLYANGCWVHDECVGKDNSG